MGANHLPNYFFILKIVRTKYFLQNMTQRDSFYHQPRNLGITYFYHFLFFKVLAKACVNYFLSCIKFLFFHQMIALYFIKKLFFFSRYSSFCSFSRPFYFADSKGQMEMDLFMTSWIGLHKFADVIFGITERPLYVMLSNWVRQYITNKRIILNLFCNLKCAAAGFKRKMKLTF